MEHHHHVETSPSAAEVMSMSTECNGDIDASHKGSWQGHVLPGILLILWGSWWMLNVLHRSAAHASRSCAYRSRSWFAMPWAPLAEPILKIAMPLFAVSMELYLDHQGQYRYLYCPPGSKWAGRFAMPHLHNWQHASSYPAIVLSGVVDLLARSLPFPPGAPRAALGFSFGVMALLMGTHAKHEPLDAAVHWLLFVSMLAVTAGLALEALLPRAPMVGVAKSATLILLGAWMWRIGAIMFENRVQWSSDYGGGAMIAPASYVWVAVLVAMAALLAYLAALAALDRGWLAEPPQDGEERHPEQCRRCGGVGRPPPAGMRAADKCDKAAPVSASSEGAAPPVACTVAGLPLYSRRRQDSGTSAELGSPGGEYSRLCSQRSEAHG